MTTNRPEFTAHDDFIFEHKEIGKVTREEFIKYIRSSHEHMRKLSELIQQYNQTIDGYLAEWDGRFESFDDDVKDLLGSWIQDGTMDHIINENLMSTKADKTYVDDLNENVTAQLAQTDDKLKLRTFTANKYETEKRGSVVFISDDNQVEDWTIFKDIFAARGVPCNTAVVADRLKNKAPSNTTLEQNLELQNEYGWEMLSHGKTHKRLASYTEADYELETKGSIDYLTSVGLNVNNFAIPNGEYNTKLKRHLKKHYRSARSSGPVTGGNTDDVLSTFSLKGTWIGYDVSGQGDILGRKINTFERYRDLIDLAEEHGRLLIISFHTWSFRVNPEYLPLFEQVLDYAVSKSRVMRLNDALDIHGNILEVGNHDKEEKSYEPHFSIGANGHIHSNQLKTIHKPIDSINFFYNPKYFEDDLVTINDVYEEEALVSAPALSPGTLITDKTNIGVDIKLVYQMYITTVNSVHVRHATSEEKWGAWETISSTHHIKGVNLVSPLNAFDSFPTGTTHVAVSRTTAEGPEGSQSGITSAGTLFTHKPSSVVTSYAFQEFYPTDNPTDKYVRRCDLDGTFGSWSIQGVRILTPSEEYERSIVDYPIGETYVNVFYSFARVPENNVPDEVGGVLKTVKTHLTNNIFNFQEYHTTRGAIYYRKIDEDGTPKEWLKISEGYPQE